MRFGVDVVGRMHEWWRGEYLLAAFLPRYGQQAKAFCVVLDNTLPHNWADPLAAAALVLDHAQDEDLLLSPTGLRNNVNGKFRFLLRTGLPSREAEYNLDLVEPGDFPYEGAENYRGYLVGTSGLDKADDTQVGRDVVNKWIQLRAEAAVRAVRACRNHEGEAHRKYLGSKWVLGGAGVLVPVDPDGAQGWPENAPGSHSRYGWSDPDGG